MRAGFGDLEPRRGFAHAPFGVIAIKERQELTSFLDRLQHRLFACGIGDLCNALQDFCAKVGCRKSAEQEDQVDDST